MKKACAFVVSATLVVGVLKAGKVFADPACSLSKSGSAEVGKTISINVAVSGDGPYGGFNGSVSYDSAYFEMVGISAGGYGAANFSKSGSSFLDYNCNIPSGATVAVIQLKCLQEGTSSVSVSMNVSSLDGTADFSTGTSASITISAPVVLSGNANLSSLTVAPGTLSPAFSKGTTNYHVTVPETTSSIAVTATPEDSKAKVSLNGVQKSLAPGDNTVKVSVTAENGDVKTYKILVTRGAPTPTPEPYPVIVNGENSYTILEPETLETIPSGFAWSETTYNSKLVPCLVG
ncbi:MAG: cadherin-like beta sandwich domain-containing protein, partial [Clostridiales bacterium]|nr:cadherin-like beta sandwich domain-containing protein [Clostridiales bacterium]